MSRTLLRGSSALLVTGALVLSATPLIAAAPASAVPTEPSLGCLVNATQSLSNPADVAIPDLPILSGVSTITAPADGVISWIRVRTDITHTNPGDLVVTLTSPLGDVLTLTSGNGGADDNVFNGTWWDDDAGETIAPGSAAEASYQNGVLQELLAPEEALANLRGQAVGGQWTLTVVDQMVGNGGTIQGWALEYATRNGGAPDTHTVSSGTLAGASIPGNQSRSFTYNVPDGIPGAVENVVADLDLTGDAGDVLATLTSPAGNVITLTNGNGGVADSFVGGTSFADAGGLLAGPVSDLLAGLLGHVPLVAPQEPLSALLGEVTTGVWTLEITNLDAVPLTLNGWSLDLTSSSCGLDGAVSALNALPSNLQVGSVFAYAVQVTNNRLAPLDLSTLGISLPQGLDLVSVTSTLGSCASLNCALGTLLPGGEAVVVYVLKVLTDGVKNLTVTLGHSGIDLVPLDNVLNLMLNVTPAPPAGGGEGPGTTPKDTTAPGLIMLLGKDKLKTVAKKGLQVLIGGTEAGTLTLKVKLPGKVAKRLKLPRLIGTKTVVLKKATTAKLRVKLTKKAAKRLAKTSKPVRIVVKGKLRDAAGNTGKATAGGKYKS
jgi:subtilisin-like proprotein convertase family protein